MSWGTLQDPAFCGRLCVTLLHSLWLVTLLAALARIVDRLVGRRAVERSYAIHVAALLASILALPATCWIVGVQEGAPSAEVAATVPADISDSPPVVSTPTTPPRMDHSAETSPATASLTAPPHGAVTAVPSSETWWGADRWAAIAPWLAAIYAAGVLVMLLRLALGMWRAQRLGAAAEILREGPLVDLLDALTKQWSMRVVPTLARAERIVTPKLIGLLRPTILLPASAVSGLSTDELALILAHELAHVRRFDMWVNLIQRLAEVVLFFNPALWYLSRRIGLLREYCCDEAVCGGTLAVDTAPHLRYAQALLRVVEVAGAGREQAELATLAASGRSPSQLRRRVARLFGEPLAESVRFSRGGLLLTAGLALLLVVGPVVWRSSAEAPTRAAPEDNHARNEDVHADQASDDKPATPSAELDPGDISIVVARHALLLEGNEIITWPELENRLKTLPDPTLARPSFYITRGTREAGDDRFAKDQIWRLHKDLELAGHSEGSLWPRSDWRYDHIKTPEDLVPDQNLRVDGTVVDQEGEPVEGAEVVLITPVDESISYKSYHMALVEGRVRHRLEHVITDSDAEGRFALYPPKDVPYYVAAIHPELGFALVADEQFSGAGKVALLKWAGLASTLDQEPDLEEQASLSTRIAESGGRPEIFFDQSWEDLKEEDAKAVFQYAHVPPFHDTIIRRSIPVGEGTSISLPAASVSLLPGETRTLGLGQLSEQQRKQLEQYRKDLEKRRQSADPQTRTHPITVFGRAIDQEGKPIADAEIFLASPRNDCRLLAVVRTGSDGSYRFEDVPLAIEQADVNTGRDKGRFEVFGVAEGYGLAWRPAKSFYPDRKQVLDTWGNPREDQPPGYGTEDSIQLDLTFGPPRAIRGRVVDDQGKPIADTKLAIRSCDSVWDENDPKLPLFSGLESLNEPAIVPPRVKVRTTDADGRFEFTGLTDRCRWSIDVSPPGYANRSIWAVSDESAEIVCARPRKLKLQVLYGDTGAPAPKVFVSAYASAARVWKTSDENGLVEFLLPDGTFHVGLLPRINSPYLRTESELIVSDETVEKVTTFKLRPAAVVDITVVDADSGEPLSGTDVWLDQTPAGSSRPYRPVHAYRSWEVETSLSHAERPRSDAEGKMRVLFEPGKHRIGVGKEAYPEGYVPVETDGKEIECQPGEPTSVVFQMRKAGTSSGESSATSASQESPDHFTLHIVDPAGKPVPAALVEIRTSPVPTPEQILQGEFVRRANYGSFAKADDAGCLVVALPQNPDRLDFSIKTPAYGPYWADCLADYRDKTVPNELTAQLEAAWSVGGIVVDEEGRPIAGVEIRSGIDYRKRPGDNQQLRIGDEFKTDEQGAWSCDSVPVSLDSVFVEVTHSDFAPNRRRLARAEFEIKRGQAPSARITLTRGLVVSGKVTDDAGKPIQGALVRTQFFNDVHQAETNEAGLYTLVGCEPTLARIVVSAQGKAVDMKEVRIEPEMGPVDFEMQPGGKVHIRVLDENDKPIPKARIFFQWWRHGQAYFPFAHVNEYADSNGVWEWNEAPHDEFQADICRPGGMQITRQKLIARDEEYVLYPPPALVVTGTVVDAETKAPVKNFQAIPGRQDADERIIWDRDEGDQSTDGTYRLVRTYGCHAHLVRIEADGYLSTVSRQIQDDEGNLTLNFELKKGQDVAATLLTPDGKPAAGAKVALGVAGSQIVVENGEFGRYTFASRTTADDSGKFHFPAQGANFQVVVTHPAGYAHVKAAPDSFPETIELTAWARVKGTYRIGQQPAGNVPLRIAVSEEGSHGADVPRVRFAHEATTASDGTFTFDRVVPGKGRIGRDLVLMATYGALEKKSSSMIAAEFPAGETVQINLGGTGRAVVGKLEPPDGFTAKVLWNFALVTLDLPKPETPASLANAPSDQEARKAWAELMKTEEGKAWNEANARYEAIRESKPCITATVGSDGTFRVDDVPVGEYMLRAGFDRESPGRLHDYRFIVSPTDDATSAPLNLGTLRFTAG